MRPRTAIGFVIVGAGALLLAACSAPPQGAETSAPEESAVAADDAMQATLEFIESGLPDLDGASIAYIAECAAQNEYCQARWAAAQEAAEDLNAEVTLFDAAFDPSLQQSQTDDAVVQDFDGYILSPVADASGCAAWETLAASGKPVATINSPMCGNPDYTEGTVGFVGMQTQDFFEAHAANAFASCEDECEAVAVGGYVGSDLFTRWEDALQDALADHPNVTLVADQPGDFDPATALSVVQDALSAHPDVEIVLTSWDDMTRGVEEAIEAAGRVPGQDVRIYSVGGNAYAVDKVASGAWTSTSVLLPREESYYGFVQLARRLATGEDTPGFTSLTQAPPVVEGPGDVFITEDNADSFDPQY